MLDPKTKMVLVYPEFVIGQPILSMYHIYCICEMQLDFLGKWIWTWASFASWTSVGSF